MDHGLHLRHGALLAMAMTTNGRPLTGIGPGPARLQPNIWITESGATEYIGR